MSFHSRYTASSASRSPTSLITEIRLAREPHSTSRANVYFAPRLEEGIGQTFLEAIRWGRCVVAADNRTINEYIIHGVNGLLYDTLSFQRQSISPSASRARTRRAPWDHRRSDSGGKRQRTP